MQTRETALAIENRMTAEGHKVVSPTGGYEGAQRDVPRADKLLRFGTFITEVSQA